MFAAAGWWIWCWGRSDAMTEKEWLRSFEKGKMLLYLKPNATARKLRFFACAFPRQHIGLFQDERSSMALDIAEDFADGKASAEQLASANSMSEFLVDWDTLVPDWEGEWAVHPLAKMAALTCRADAFDAAWLVPQMISDITYYGGADPDFPKSKLEAAEKDLDQFHPLLLDIFGNPFRPVTLERACLTPKVKTLAQAIYDDRAFERMPELADALAEAGCSNQDILSHCRGPGPHVRGCWVVDLVLEKE